MITTICLLWKLHNPSDLSRLRILIGEYDAVWNIAKVLCWNYQTAMELLKTEFLCYLVNYIHPDKSIGMLEVNGFAYLVLMSGHLKHFLLGSFVKVLLSYQEFKWIKKVRHFRENGNDFRHDTFSRENQDKGTARKSYRKSSDGNSDRTKIMAFSSV